MNKRNVTRALTGIFAGATTIAALIATPALGEIIPMEYAKYLLLATTGLLCVKELVVVIGDYLDDGERNNGFKP